MIRAVLIKFSIFYKKSQRKDLQYKPPEVNKELAQKISPNLEVNSQLKTFFGKAAFCKKNVKSCRIRTFIPDNVESFRFWAFFETLEENKIILVPHFGQILVDWVNFYGLGNFFS